MSEPIENEYFNWLCAKASPRGGVNHIGILRVLHSRPFEFFIPGDRNRAEDGCELKVDFRREIRCEGDPAWFSEPCSILEMLVAFSRRAAFQTDISDHDWFWEFMTNLGLNEYRRVSVSDEPYIQEILNVFMYRTYDPSGHGGMFPLHNPMHDQREVELWYQFYEYLTDRGL